MKSALTYIHNRLDSLYTSEQVQTLIRWIMSEICHIPTYRLLLKEDKLSEEEHCLIFQITDRLAQQEPIQYILGYSQFCDLTFKLSRDVLIPRPETEELVRQILADYKDQPVHLLDIGTGSGCIAISLAYFLSKAKVEALDISDKALMISRENARLNHVDVRFFQQDIMAESTFEVLSQYDCIVSNPPYVTMQEKSTMERRVLEYEPALALFVPDNDPLRFYCQIIQIGKTHLRKNGRLYFEINERFGKEIVDLLYQENYKKVELIRDFYGKDRIIRAEL